MEVKRTVSTMLKWAVSAVMKAQSWIAGICMDICIAANISCRFEWNRKPQY